MYVLIVLVAPISGIILAGQIFSRIKAGYASAINYPICFVLNFVGIICGLMSVTSINSAIVVWCFFI